MRFSTDETDPGYARWLLWRQVYGAPLVFLDGVEQTMVETVDEEEGFIVRVVTDSDGNIIVENDELRREMLYGNVEIRAA